jgi:sulfur carrier protein
MQLTVNGEKQQVDGDAWDVARLLTALKVERPDTVVVQVNGEFVDKSGYASTRLKASDEIDFLYFMGGGQ